MPAPTQPPGAPQGLFDLYQQNLGQGMPQDFEEGFEGLPIGHDESAEPDESAQRELAREALLQAAQQRAAASQQWQGEVAKKNEDKLGGNDGGGGY